MYGWVGTGAAWLAAAGEIMIEHHEYDDVLGFGGKGT